MYKWLKYNHKFSHGASETQYKFLGIVSEMDVISSIDDILYDLQKEFDYSETYRGIDYSIVDETTIDIKYLKQMLEDSNKLRDYYADLSIQLEEMVHNRITKEAL